MEKNLKKREKYWDTIPITMPPPFLASSECLGDFETNMVMRRILIRVVTSQSEMLAYKASQYRFTKPVAQWKLGADTYCESLSKIHEALELADSQCAKLLFTLNDNTLEGESLAEDAQIVEIAIQYLREECDRYREAAVQQAHRLSLKLKPKQKSRDQAKKRVGNERWTNNPAPKNDYRKLREQDELQLLDVQAAIQQLDQMLMPQGPKFKKQMESQKPKHRYNGARPWDMSRRLPMDDFPDPTDFDWIFTGSSNNNVEFFERIEEDESIVKLDWYFTTGTVKTSLDHPMQGKTQMFASEVDPVTYRHILHDPRAHTNVRYQTRSNKHSK